MSKKISFLFLFVISWVSFIHAENPEKKEKFNASETILHHILDAHDWEIIEDPQVKLSLPWMLYSSRDGFCFYANTESMVHDGKFGVDHHGKPFAAKAGAAPHTDAHQPSHDQPAHDSTKTEEHHADNIDESVSVIDFSMTKTALQMLIVAIIMVILFTSIAKSYAKNVGKAPSGAQSLFEPVIVFVRDLAKEYLGKKHYERFLPYLLTLFFFIWFANLLGLTPLNSNIAGNFTVTSALAVLSFFLINKNGTKDYWHHILAMPGVPKMMLIILTPIEILSVFIKPAALAIRLFANIVAGHFMVLSLICLVFILGNAGESVGGAFGGGIIGIPFAIAIFCLEMLVAIIQAYIFTLLTTVFLGMALESHDDHHHAEEHDEVLNSEVNKDLRLSDFGAS